MSKSAARAVVLTFGESLWDIFPDRCCIGGAPLNVAYHLHHHGVETMIVSAVGCDQLGEDLIASLHRWGLGTAGVGRHSRFPTGQVAATPAMDGQTHYVIRRDVAWDEIPIPEGILEIAKRARALVFGSLAQRSPVNRTTLDRLLASLPLTAERVYDVNLRAPHDDLALVRGLAGRATLLKLNAAEAARLATGEAESPGCEEAHARALEKSLRCPTVCVTAGERGAGLLRNGNWLWEPGRPVVIADTVGAGDAFLAGLLAGLIEGMPSAETLARACRLGEWVASEHGATPSYPESSKRAELRG
jgi:fructokinase